LRGAHIHGSHDIRVWAEIMRSQKCGTVGKSQPVLIIINLIIFTRTRIARGGALHLPWRGVWSVAAAWLRGWQGLARRGWWSAPMASAARPAGSRCAACSRRGWGRTRPWSTRREPARDDSQSHPASTARPPARPPASYLASTASQPARQSVNQWCDGPHRRPAFDSPLSISECPAFVCNV
jgi:hypothetical protein